MLSVTPAAALTLVDRARLAGAVQGGHVDNEEETGPAPKRRASRREQTPVQRALGLLVRRDHSQRELTRKLTQRGIDPEEAQAAVARLNEAGWQDDARFAHSLVRMRAGGGYGPLHIRAELNTHGLPAELVAEALEAYEGDWADNARDLVQRRFGQEPLDMGQKRKASDLLARRGFPSGLIRSACTGNGQDWDDQD